jgi:hypothetical protein
MRATIINIDVQININQIIEYLGSIGWVQDAAEILRQPFMYWKLSNGMRLLNKINEKAKSKGIGIPNKQLSMKFLHGLVDDGFIEDDENLQDMWANLAIDAMVNSKDKGNDKLIFLSILKMLAPSDKPILNVLYNALNAHASSGFKVSEYVFLKKIVMDAFKLDISAVNFLISKYAQLGICQLPDRLDNVVTYKLPAEYQPSEVIIFTDLGFYFLKACIEPH